MKPPFEKWDMSEVARTLADAMERHRARCEAEARALDAALEGKSRQPPVPRYVDNPESNRQSLKFWDAFPTWNDFVGAVRSEDDAGALEVALLLLSQVAPTEILPLARTILSVKPWHGMGSHVGRALAQVDDPAAVELALANWDVAYVMEGVEGSVCARAWPLVMARLEASPVMDTTRKRYARSETFLVESLLPYFAKHRTEAAWPVLARLYEESADEYVVLASGHALVTFGDERSLAVLKRFVVSKSERRRFFAVKAHLHRGATSALDALGGVEALGKTSRMALASELMEQVWRVAWESKTPIEDDRYLDLALAWVKDRRVKSVAQWVLDSFGKPKVSAAKKRLTKAGKIKKPVPKQKPQEADIVAVHESMRRARSNLERIVAELGALGYAFDAKVPLGKPATAKTIAAIEKALGGPLPVSLRAAFEIIGACDLTGTFPGQPRSLESDAFFLVDAKSALEEVLEEGGGEAQVSLAIAPDAVGKAGFSGGQEVILVPDGSLDAGVIGVSHEPLFLDRLREVFRCGGFPGLARAKGDLGATVRRLARVCDPI